MATYEENASGSSLSAYITSKEMDFEFNFIRASSAKAQKKVCLIADSPLPFLFQSSQYSVMRYSQSTNGTDIQANLSVVEGKYKCGNVKLDVTRINL